MSLQMRGRTKQRTHFLVHNINSNSRDLYESMVPSTIIIRNYNTNQEHLSADLSDLIVLNTESIPQSHSNSKLSIKS